MRYIVLLIFASIFFTPESPAQIIRNDSLVIQLSPVFIHKSRFYHNSKRISFDGLVYLFQAMNDDELNRIIKSIYTIRTVVSLLQFGAATYGIIIINSSRHTLATTGVRAAYIILGASLLSLPLAIMELAFQKRAVKRYNELLLQIQEKKTSGQGL